MKLVTFQSYEALKYLINNGYLECDEKHINVEKVGKTYLWILDKMKKQFNKNTIKYPIWCWVKCYNGVCPPKHKGKKVDGFDVKITFNKNEKDVFITDFRRYSFLLNNMYIPFNIEDKEKFDKILRDNNITLEELEAFVRPDKYKEYRNDEKYLEICDKIKGSFDRCITHDSDILQGCVERINIHEIESIEILPDDGYRYGSLNYVRSNGKTMNWRQDFYTKLKK